MVKLAKKIALTPREFAFAEALLSGMNGSDALRHAYPELVKKWKVSSIHVQASKMRKDPKIEGYIQEQLANRQRRRLVKEADLLTRIEKRATLADCVRAESVDWSQRLQAIKIDNEMTGDATIRVEQEVTIGVILQNLAAGSVIPSAEERALLDAKPVQPIHTIESNGHSNSHHNGNGKAPIPGPYAADFEEMGAEVYPEPTKRVEEAPPTQRRREYED